MNINNKKTKKMKKVKLLTLLTVLLVVFSFEKTQAQDANAILKKIDNILTAPSSIYENVSITLIDRTGRKQVRTANVWMKGKEQRLFRFTSPSSSKGISFLSLPKDVMYLYMPAFGKERRIASSVKNQKFAGTDLTYDELQSKDYSQKYSAKLLKTQGNLYVLQLTPKEKSHYSKLIMKVDKTNNLPTYLESFDRGGNKVKTSSMIFAKSGNFWYAKKLTVKDLKTKHSTIMTVSSVKFNTSLSNEIFSVRNLKK